VQEKTGHKSVSRERQMTSG